MDGEYHSQARQALLIAVYQLVGAGFGLLMYWNYQMVHPYLTPIFWAIICSTALHTTKTKFVGYLMHCDRLLDTRCLRWERHNFCTRAIARFLMIPGLVVSETLLKVLGAPTSRGGNRLVKLCTWLASAASHVIRKLGDFEVNFRLGLAVVAIACVVSLVGYTGSFLVDTFWLICISSVILCIILSILIMLIIYPKYSEATYSTIVSASLLFFFVVFIGLILSVAALKVTHIEKLLLEAREREREREQRAQEAEEARRRMSDMRKLQGTNGLSTLSGTNTLVGRSGTHTPATNEPQSAEQSIKS
eukprot:438626_1